NVPGQVRQLQASATYAQELANELHISARDMRAWSEVAAGTPNLTRVMLASADAPGLAAAYSRVAQSGFTQNEIDRFHAFGYTDDDITIMRTHTTTGLADVPLDTTYPDALKSIAAAIDADADAFSAFATDVSNAARHLVVASNHVPSAS